jgi:hypothetical protein
MSETQPKPEDDLIDRLSGEAGQGVVHGVTVMRYVAGAIRRERQRLAEIFERAGMQEIASQIADSALDPNVFRFRPPSIDLHRQTNEPRDAQPGTILVVGDRPKKD